MPFRPNNPFLTLLLSALLVAVPSFSLTGQGNVSLKTVVIDAGHGGHDPGAVSPDKKTREKDINLSVALLLGEKIQNEYPDVKVIYTRKTDIYKTLVERSDIANRNNADLFISIHVNSAKSSSAAGTETFVMGTDKSSANMEVCKRENSVILLEDDYSTAYQGFDPNNPESYIFFNLMQNSHFEQSISLASYVQQQFKKGPIVKSRGIKQAPLLVLWKTTMPSILVEIGFISNASDRNIITKKEHQNEIAEDIFKAFCTFKTQYDSHTVFEIPDDILNDDSEEEGDDAQTVEESVSEPDNQFEQKKQDELKGRFYRVQIMAVNRKLPAGSSDLKGITDYNCDFINGLYKYSVGNFTDKDEAMAKMKELKGKFPGAFLVIVDK